MNHAEMAGMSGHAPGAPAMAAAMWMAMMVTMMLPSLAPALRQYHRMIDRPGASPHPAWSTAAMAAGYYAVWVGVGVALIPLGGALAAVQRWLPMLVHSGPFTVGVVVVVAGALQFTAWKVHHLACCRAMSVRGMVAWRDGVRLGVHCCLSCAGPMAILVAAGSMDLRAMAVVTAAITIERVAPDGVRAARTIGAIAMGVGLVLIAHAVSSGPT
jgi:predicted metal-binding membrane protein